MAIRAGGRNRDARERLQEIIEAVEAKQGSAAAEIGTGYGYYAVRFWPVAGASGSIYAEAIDGALARKLRWRVQAEKLQNIQPVLWKPYDPGLPGSVLDAALLADVYHEVDSPALLLRIKVSLKPGGRLMIIEYLRPELRSESRDWQRKEHNVAPEFVEQDLKEAGFEGVQRRDPLGPGYPARRLRRRSFARPRDRASLMVAPAELSKCLSGLA